MNSRIFTFQKYERKIKSSYLREVTQEDIDEFIKFGIIYTDKTKSFVISISDADLSTGSPEIGDMIAVNENTLADQWLINKTYFHENFCTEPVLDNNPVTISK